MVTKTIFGLAALFAAMSVMGCEVIAGLDKNFHPSGSGTGGSAAGGATTTGASGGGGTGGTGTGTSTGGATCMPVHVPDPPNIADDGGDIDFVVALHTIDVGEMSFDVKIGLDIDNVCTCTNGAPGTCKPLANTVCDGPNGIDNALGLIFATVHQVSGNLITSGQLSKAANDGRWTGLLRVRGYNGKPDDAKVELSTYSTQGVAAGMPTPQWMGEDQWPVDDDSLVDGMNVDAPILKSTQGYVTGGVLVARYPSQGLRIRGDLFRLDIHMQDFVARAKLSAAAGGGYQLTEGVIAGKWPLTSTFKDLSTIKAVGQTLCTNDGNYVTVKAAICGDADLRIDGTNGACDALSFGATFTSDPAKLGPVVKAVPTVTTCAPDKDPSSDTCN